MIIDLMVLLAASVVETHVLPVAGYLIASVVLVQRRGLATTLPLLVVAGVVLDILTPRHLGITPLAVMIVLLGTFVWLGKTGRDDWRMVVTFVILIIGEGVVTSRSTLGILAGCLLTVILVLGNKILTTSSSKGIIVRRQL